MAARMNQQETRARERRRDNTGLQLLGSRSYVPLGLEAPDNVQELVWTGCGHRWESEQLPTWSNHYWACWFVIGVACQCRYILLPSPPKLIEALLVVAMTVDYVASDAFPRADVQIFGKGR